ncbi:MAG: hypothetical protein ABL931_12010 [Usitatibacteraceae bacterium]
MFLHPTKSARIKKSFHLLCGEVSLFVSSKYEQRLVTSNWEID